MTHVLVTPCLPVWSNSRWTHEKDIGRRRVSGKVKFGTLVTFDLLGVYREEGPGDLIGLQWIGKLERTRPILVRLMS